MERDSHGQDKVLNPDELTEAFEPILGQAVTLRALRRDDQDIENAFVSGLSAETRHNRLLGGARRITREYIEQLTSVDFSRDMALAATVMLEGRETLIGVARYVRAADAASCEFALVVADAWQGRGIGRKLMEKLVEIARTRGLEEMFGDVLATNRPMLRLARALGFELSPNPEDATVTRLMLVLRS